MLLLLFAAFLVWLNGPGWRWLGKIGIEQALTKSNMKADFTLQGTLLGGIRVEKLSLSGGAVRKLEIDAVEPLYKVTRVLKGDWNAVLEGVKVRRIDAVIDLAAAPPKDPNEPEKPFDPDVLAESLRKTRKFLLPLDLGAADLRLQVLRGDEKLVTLDTTNFGHAPGSDDFVLKLGTIAAGPGYALEAQDSVITWKEDSLYLNRFDFSPRVGIDNLLIGMPKSGGMSAAGVVRIEDSRLVLDGTTTRGHLRMEGAPLPLHEAAKNFAFGLPVEATLRSLDAEFIDFQKKPIEWLATAKAELSDIRYEDWRVANLKYEASKSGSDGKLNFSVAALDSTLTGEGDLHWRDLTSGTWTDFEANTKLKVPQLSPLYAALNQKFHFAPPEAKPLPASALTLDAKADMGPEKIRSASATWLLSPEKDAPSLAGEVKWTPDGKLGGTLGSDGLRATYALDLTGKTYEATANFEGFRPERLTPWSMAAGVELPTGMNATGSWQGSGAFAAEPHQGNFDIPSFEYVRQDTPPLILRTKGDYHWPQEVNLTSLTAVAEGQTITAQAALANRVLKIPKIEWKDGETRLVGGQAEIPVPEKPGDVKAFLKQTEPISVFLESEWIDNARLAAWMPEKKSPLADGSGRVHLVITGTPAAPKINLETQLKGLRVPEKPDVPVTDAAINIDGEGGSLALKGDIRPAGYPPVTLSGKMPFKPGEWADDPKSVLEEKFEARANIPRLELATFQKMVPSASQLGGSLEGYFAGSGTIGKPDLSGELRLSNGAVTLKDSEVPPITGANAVVRLQGKEVLLQSLAVELAAGTVRGSGRVGLADAAKPTFDLSIKGQALPLKRDESMIVRADADLALRGDLQQATISGTVDIVDSLFYKDVEILPLRVPFTAPSRPKLPSIDPERKSGAGMPEPFRNWALNVRVRTRDPLLIRGNLAKGVVVANVLFGGTLGNIQPQGNATIGEVTARLPFSTLKVDNGAVVFTPAGGLTPELNIRGTSTVGRYDLSLYFYGPVSSPKTALTSDPPLPENEIMTLLATGTTSDGLEGGQAATLKAAQLLVEEWRKGRLPFADQVSKVMEVVNKVDVRINEDDPLTGKRLNSATIEVTDRWYASGSVDKQSNTRVLGAFVIKFK